MALVKCKDCGAQVSNQAPTCPQCGAPIKKAPKQIGCLGFVVALLFLGFVVSMVIGTVDRSSPTPVAEAPKPPPPAPELLAQMKAFEDAKQWRAAAEAGRRLVAAYPASEESKAAQARLPELDKSIAQEQAARVARIEAARAAAVKGLTRSRDDMRNLTFYYAPGVNLKNVGNRFGLYLAVPDSGPPYVRFSWMYFGDDWLFVKQILVKVDNGQAVALPYSTFAVERDNNGGKVWEWSDEQAKPDTFAFFERIATSSNTTVRYEGRQYNKDRQLSAAERQGIARIIKAYRDLTAQ